MTAKYSGKFVVFEGVNGCGKSTQVTMASNWIRANHPFVNVVATKEPTEGFVGKQIRRALADQNIFQVIGLTGLQSWYALDSLQHLQEKVIPALEKGDIVLCDRYRHSLVHSALFKSDIPVILELNKKILGQQFLTPDLVLVFEVSPEIAMERLAKKGTVFDAQETITEISRTHTRYLELVEFWPDNLLVVNGNRSEQDIFSDVKQILLARFAGLF